MSFPDDIALAAGLRGARKRVAPARLTPFDAEPWCGPDDFVRFADAMMRRGWHPPGDRLESLTPPIPWGKGGRSFVMHVHAWLPLKDILAAHHATGERRYFDTALAFALDWALTHPHFVPRERDKGDGGEDGFAWYDQAVGLRFCRLAYILDAALRLDDVSDETLAALIAAFREHVTAIADDREFRRNTNHGLYQALGQLSAATRFVDVPELVSSAFLTQANERLTEMVKRQYFPEGMHREHSPGYHFATWRALSAAIGDGIVREPRLAAMLSEIEQAMSWLFDGQARIATIGDTDPWTAPKAARLANIRDARLRSVLAREGDPAETLKGFAQSGYASVQHFRGARRSFLLQATGFHSVTHKHADHLSFVWTENDIEILIDPGRWGYVGRTPHDSELFKLGFWYDAPERVFVESTRAHNVVESDGKEFPRRGARPYGSGLQDWGGQDGLYYVLSRAPLTGHAMQRRLLVLSPGDFLLVLDRVSDREPRRWRQWFHLGPKIAAEWTQGAIRAPGLSAIALLPEQRPGPVIAGQKEPQMQGWYCPRAGALEPAPAFAMQAPDATHATFATLFALTGDAAPLESRVEGDRAELAWMQDGKRRALSLHIADKVAFGAKRSWLGRLFS
ncbi:MAG TPA: heparinase II/III family protein [Rhizomicrobium sp.]|nr:heparinase II/III family protein [Rhizomicrobium sp.]